MSIRTEKVLLTQQEAAKRLGITQPAVSQLVHAEVLQSLRGERGNKFVTAQSVYRYLNLQRSSGAPLTASAAMGMLFLLSQERAPWLSRQQLYRAKKRLHDYSAEELVWAVRKRAARKEYWISDGKLNALAESIAISGCTGRKLCDVFNLSPSAIVEGYINSCDLGKVEREFRLTDAEPEKVRLHILPDDMLMPRGAGDSLPIAVCAADLAESADPRERGAGLKMLSTLLDQWKGNGDEASHRDTRVN